MVMAFCAVLATSAQRTDPARESYDAFTRAIRANDLPALRQLARTPGAVNTESSLHSKPLHYAAIYGSADSIRILLAAGADPEARNQQAATALIYGAWDATRTKLLIEKGALVNVAAKEGTTPLMIAASVMGNAASVRCLLERGADPKATDSFGTDALIRAGGMSDPQVVELLLAKGADAHHADGAGFTALQMAPAFPDHQRVDLLLKAGADVNSFNTFAPIVKNGPIALTHLTPLLSAASYSDTASIRALLAAGARVNDVDIRKMSPLMMAVATDQAKPATVKQLIAAGGDVNARDRNGESVLDWARKFANPEIVSVLESAGAQGRGALAAPQPPGNSQAADPRQAIARTLPLLARTSAEFFKAGGGCNGCHHQVMSARVYGAAADSGARVDENMRQPFKDAQLAERPAYLAGLPLMRALPGDVDRILASLIALADLHSPASDFTDAAVHYLALRQSVSGAWIEFAARPPIHDSVISRTSLAIRALRVYGWAARRPEFDERVQRARLWLANARPVTTYEEADRITGLQAAGVSAATLRADAESLLRKQRPDGGWAQTPYLESDAYATGLTLHSLYGADLLVPDTPSYQRGVAFLLRTQFPDGSWYVRSRSPKFQPYFQSGFPFDHDQWISSAATAWATMALMHVPAEKTYSNTR